MVIQAQFQLPCNQESLQVILERLTASKMLTEVLAPLRIETQQKKFKTWHVQLSWRTTTSRSHRGRYPSSLPPTLQATGPALLGHSSTGFVSYPPA
jgi:hypothetical protein